VNLGILGLYYHCFFLDGLSGFVKVKHHKWIDSYSQYMNVYSAEVISVESRLMFHNSFTGTVFVAIDNSVGEIYGLSILQLLQILICPIK
jgi:hypothetical protein